MSLKNKRNIKKITYQLVKNGKVKTTVPLAKDVKKKAERLINKAKKDTTANRRYVAKTLPDDAVNKLFTVLGPAAKDRNGGYTSIHRIGPRKGDGTEICLLEIIDV